MKERKEIIPYTMLYKIYDLFYRAYIDSLDQKTIPSYVLVFFNYFVTLTTPLCFLPFDDKNFILHIFEVLIYFLSGNHSSNAATIAFIVYFVAFIIYLISSIAISYVVTKNGKHSKHLANFLVFDHLILTPQIIMFMASEVGNHILVITIEGLRASPLIQTVILLFCIAFLISIEHFVTNNIPVFIEGVSMFFTAEAGTLYYSCVAILRILAFFDNVEKFGLISTVLSCVIMLLIIIFGIYTNIFIRIDDTSIKLSLIVGSFFYCLLSSLFKMDSSVIITMYCIASFFGQMVVRYFLIKRVTRSLSKFDLILKNENSIENVYPRISLGFYIDHCNAFVQGHECVLMESFYENIGKVFPFQERLFIQSAKILSVYRSQYSYLEKFMYENDSKLMSYIEKLFRIGMKKLMLKRKTKESSEYKHKIRLIKRDIRENKESLITYWKDIQEGRILSVFTVAEKCRNYENKINELFVKLINDYESCQRTYKLYIKYLEHVSCDFWTATTYRNKLKTISEMRSTDPDRMEIETKKMFTNLPNSITEERFIFSIESKNQNGSQSSLSTELSSVDEFKEEMMEKDIRKICDNIKFKANNWLTFFLVLNFLASFGIGIILLHFIVTGGFKTYNSLLDFLGIFTSMLLTIPKCSYDILSDGLINAQTFNTVREEMALTELKTQLPLPSEDISKDVLIIQNNIDSYVNLISSAIKYSPDLMVLRRTLAGDYITFFDDNEGNRHISVEETKYAAVINLLSADYMSYSLNDSIAGQDFSNEPWFLSCVINENQCCYMLNEFSEVISVDMGKYMDIVSYNIFIIPLGSTICDIILTIICIAIGLYAFNQYHHIVRIMSYVQPIAIIEKCNNLKKGDSNEMETKTKEALTNGIVDRIGRSVFVYGVILLIISNAVFITETWVYGSLLNSDEQEVRVLPKQKYYISLVCSRLNRQLSLLKRCVSAANGKDIDPNVNELHSIFYRSIEELSNSSKLLFVGNKDDENSYLTKFNWKTTQIFMQREKAYNASSTYYETFDSLSVFEAFEIIINEMIYFGRNIKNETVMNKDNERLINLLNIGRHTIVDLLYEAEQSTSSVGKIIQRKNSDAIFIVLVFLVLNTVLMFFSIIVQFSVKDIERFTLKTIGMLNNEYVTGSEGLEALLSGNFNVKTKKETIKLHYMKAIRDHTDILEFRVDNGLLVKACNKVSEKFIKDNNIAYLQNLVPVSEELKEALHSNNEFKTSIESTFTEDYYVNEKEKAKRDYKMKIDIYKLPNEEETIVIALRDRKDEKIKQIRKEIDQKFAYIEKKVIPHDFREFLTSEKPNIKTGKILIISAKCCNIPFTDDVNESKDYLTKFNSANYKAIKKGKDILIIKKMGTVIFSVCNVREQSNNINESIEDAFSYIKELKILCEAEGIKITCAITKSEESVIGRLSPRTVDFNIYAKEVEENFRFVRKGETGELYVSSQLYDKIPKFKSLNQKFSEKDANCCILDLDSL